MAEATIATPKAKDEQTPAHSKCRNSKCRSSTCRRSRCRPLSASLPRSGVAQAKDTYEKMKAAAEEATDVLESTYSTATKGASDYGLKVIEVARANTNAAFDFAGEIMAAKTLSEVVELTSAHARKQFEALTAQSKELSALAQKVATETAEPIKAGMTKAFNKAN